MVWLVLGLVFFLGIHSVSIVSPTGRSALAARLGENGWKGLYSVVALAGFVLIVVGYGAARQAPVPLWEPVTGLRHAAALLMLPVFPLLIASQLPCRLGAVVKHPMLLATKFWALSHLLANHTLADLLLFGGFLAWAVADRISVKRREAAGLLAVRRRPAAWGARDAVAVVGGLALYGLFVAWAHAALFGIRPFG